MLHFARFAYKWALALIPSRSIRLVDTLTIEGRYKRRTFGQWVRRRPRERQVFTVICVVRGKV